MYSGTYIAEIKVLGKGAKKHYKPLKKGMWEVERRAAEIPPNYQYKASYMDA